MVRVSSLSAGRAVLANKEVIIKSIMVEHAAVSRVSNEVALTTILANRIKEMIRMFTMEAVPKFSAANTVEARVYKLLTMRFLARMRAGKEIGAMFHRCCWEHRYLTMLKHSPMLRVIFLNALVTVLTLKQVVSVPRVVVLHAVLWVAQQLAAGPLRAVRQLCVVVPLPAVKGVVQLVAALPFVARMAVTVQMPFIPNSAAMVKLGAKLKWAFCTQTSVHPAHRSHPHRTVLLALLDLLMLLLLRLLLLLLLLLLALEWSTTSTCMPVHACTISVDGTVVGTPWAAASKATVVVVIIIVVVVVWLTVMVIIVIIVVGRGSDFHCLWCCWVWNRLCRLSSSCVQVLWLLGKCCHFFSLSFL